MSSLVRAVLVTAIAAIFHAGVVAWRVAECACVSREVLVVTVSPVLVLALFAAVVGRRPTCRLVIEGDLVRFELTALHRHLSLQDTIELPLSSLRSCRVARDGRSLVRGWR